MIVTRGLVIISALIAQYVAQAANGNLKMCRKIIQKIICKNLHQRARTFLNLIECNGGGQCESGEQTSVDGKLQNHTFQLNNKIH
jgi:hypothetical protein